MSFMDKDNYTSTVNLFRDKPIKRRKDWRVHFTIVCLINCGFLLWHAKPSLDNPKEVIIYAFLSLVIGLLLTLLLDLCFTLIKHSLLYSGFWGGDGILSTKDFGINREEELEQWLRANVEQLNNKEDWTTLRSMTRELSFYQYYHLFEAISTLWVTVLASGLVVKLGWLDKLFPIV